MLTEVICCRKIADDRLRRWFSSKRIDLFVWYEDREIFGFQICYDKGRQEHALTWRTDLGWSHKAVEAGNEGTGFKGTAILVPDGEVPVTRIIDEFEVASQDLDPKVLQLIIDKLPEARTHLRDGDD